MHFKEVKGILSSHNGMNIYRGCTHGCIYCDSRSDCYQMEHDFEDIEVKSNAVELLELALSKKRKKCMIGTGSMCDPYMHCEETLLYTRRCLEVIDKYGFGASVLTKSARVLRDMDLLKSINAKTKAVVQMTLTTYDEDLCAVLEPHVSGTLERVNALKAFKENGIPTVVWLGPILPFINDTEENLRGILQYCVEAGVHGILCFGFGVTLRSGDREYFYQKLDEHFPGVKKRYQQRYGYDYIINSDNHPALMRIFTAECKRNGILCNADEVFKYVGTFEEKQTQEQLTLF